MKVYRCQIFKLVIISMLLPLLFTGCSLTGNKDKAEEIAVSYFNSVKSKDFAKSMTYYSAEFFQVTKEDDWKKALENINKKLGDLQSYELQGWNINKQFGKGTYYSLKYKVTYSKYTATEVITLFKKGNKDDILIVGHNINTDGLLKE